MQIDIAPRSGSVSAGGAFVRCYLACLLAGAPLAVVMLLPGLMRSRAEYAPGLSMVGISAFIVLSFLLIACAPELSARTAGGPGWRPGMARRVSRAVRRAAPRLWWRRAAEVGAIFAVSQLVGGAVAWVVPYIWRDASGTGWVLHYPNYALQAVAMYLVIVAAAAWFGTRIRQLAVAAEVRDGGSPVA